VDAATDYAGNARPAARPRVRLWTTALTLVQLSTGVTRAEKAGPEVAYATRVRSEPVLADIGVGQFLANLDGLTALYAAAMAPPPQQLPGRRAIMERHAGHTAFRAVVATLPPDCAPAAPGPGSARDNGSIGDGSAGTGPAHYGLAVTGPGDAELAGTGPAGTGPTSTGLAGTGPTSTGPAAVAGPVTTPGAAAGGTPSGPRLVGFAYGFHGETGQWWHDLVGSALAQHQGRRAARSWMSDSFEVAEVHVHPAYQGHGTGHAMLVRLVAGRPEHTAVLSTMDADTSARRLYRGVGFADLLPGFVFPGANLPYTIMGATLPLADRATLTR
jgi:GNAT superfamily N-acetyltransferase